MLNRISLYDLLSMVIPGYLVIFLVTHTFFGRIRWPYDPTSAAIVTFCASYIIGLLVHYLSRSLFIWLNNIWLSNKASQAFERDVRKRQRQSHKNTNTAEWRYKTAYRLWGIDTLSFLPLLEAQLSFLRSLSVTGIFYLILGSGFITCSGIMSLIAIAVIVCVCMMVFLRLKIYYYYYEADYYLNNQPNKR